MKNAYMYIRNYRIDVLHLLNLLNSEFPVCTELPFLKYMHKSHALSIDI